jgi:hypothetical protein
VFPYWTRIPYLTWKTRVAACGSKFPYLFVHYKQGFLPLQGEQQAAIFGGLSLLLSFISLAGFPYFKGDYGRL